MDKNQFEKTILDISLKYDNIFIFISKKDEVDTLNIIEQLLNKNKNVIVPICDIDKNEIILSKIENIKDLKKSSYGISEPKKIIPFSKQKIDIFFVPGTLFDKKGNRKGRGKGYFDRFLKDVDKNKIIGLCYEDQLIEKIEDLNTWDVPVNKIYTCERK